MKDLGIDPGNLADLRQEDHKPAANWPPATEPYEPSEEELAALSPHQLQRYQQLEKQRPPWLPHASVMPAFNDAHRTFERDFVSAGGRLLVGGDASDFGVVPGYANHSAMIALVTAGFDPVQVIRFATRDAAEFLRVGDTLGTVAAGKGGDLLIVAGSPDKRIEDIRRVAYVFKDGKSYDPAKSRAATKGQVGLH